LLAPFQHCAAAMYSGRESRFLRQIKTLSPGVLCEGSALDGD
jgi:hypothetical protein